MNNIVEKSTSYLVGMTCKAFSTLCHKKQQQTLGYSNYATIAIMYPEYMSKVYVFFSFLILNLNIAFFCHDIKHQGKKGLNYYKSVKFQPIISFSNAYFLKNNLRMKTDSLKNVYPRVLRSSYCVCCQVCLYKRQ